MNNVHKILVVLILISAIQLACNQSVGNEIPSTPKIEEVEHPAREPRGNFSDPKPVSILGYDGDAMEPFISKDDQYLFFNNRNDQSVDTNLHYAERVDDLTFQYMGEISNINSNELDAVASMDAEGNFYFISIRNYPDTLSTIFKGRFDGGQVTQIELVPGLSVQRPGHVNFDAEISSDGRRIYFVDGQFGDSNIPEVANLVVATRRGETFERTEAGIDIFQHINSDALEYAPAISSDELEIFFTRLEPDLSAPPAIFQAVRNSIEEPFRTPELVSVISGFVEAPTLSSGENIMYYHKQEHGKFVIYQVSR